MGRPLLKNGKGIFSLPSIPFRNNQRQVLYHLVRCPPGPLIPAWEKKQGQPIPGQ